MLESMLGIKSLSPDQKEIIDNIKSNDYSVLIFPDQIDRNYILANFIIEEALLNPGSNTCVFSSGWRYSKSLGLHIVSILENADILNKKISLDIDAIKITLGKSTITCIPIGSGSRIRSQRANILVGLNTSAIDKDFRNNILASSCLMNGKTKIILSDIESSLSDSFEEEISVWSKEAKNFYLYRQVEYAGLEK